MRTNKQFVQCPICGKSFTSLFPAHLKSHGLTLPEFKIAHPGVPYQTKELEEKRSSSATRINTGRPVSEETKRKVSQSLFNSPHKVVGEAHPRWNGGGDYGIVWNALSQTLIDKYKVCQSETCRNNSVSLIVHHKDNNSKNNDLDNLIVLCKSCHAIVHGVSPSEENRKKRKVFHKIQERDEKGRIVKR